MSPATTETNVTGEHAEHVAKYERMSIHQRAKWFMRVFATIRICVWLLVDACLFFHDHVLKALLVYGLQDAVRLVAASEADLLKAVYGKIHEVAAGKAHFSIPGRRTSSRSCDTSTVAGARI